MKKSFIPILALAGLLVSGCSYKAPVETVKNINVYSSYEGRIPGSFDLIINVDPGLAQQEIKPSSYICGLHRYPIDAASPIRSSIYTATERLFEQVSERDDIPSIEGMKKENKAGYIRVRLKELAATMTFSPGFFTDTATASCDSGIEVEIRDQNNSKVYETAVSGNRSVTGDSGLQCGGGAEVLADAIRNSFRETLERYAERLSNAVKIREHFSKVR